MMKTTAVRALFVVLAAAAVAFPVRARAADSPAVLYRAARAQEQAARAKLDRPAERNAAALTAIRATVHEYETLVRRYPSSGYCDDALWHGAQLAADGFTYFGDPRDRATAVTLIHWLQTQYPHSPYAHRAPGAIARSVPDRRTVPAARAPRRQTARVAPSRTASSSDVAQPLDAAREAPPAKAEASARQDALAQPRHTHPPLRPRPYPGMRPSAPAPLLAMRFTDPSVTSLPSAESRPPSVEPTPVMTVAANDPAAPGAPRAPAANLNGGLSVARQLGLGISRIVIDPGHGGRDPGAQANGLTEADLTLDIALRLQKLLEQQPGVQVILTRRTDVYVPLQERTAIANRANADLFLSIHANASLNAQAHGIETYFLNFASDEEEAAVAARENAMSGDTMGSLSDLVKAIALNTKLNESRDFATMVQQAMYTGISGRDADTRNLGVKQAPFAVLIGAAMPSVLAEISFVTNDEDASYLKRDAFRQAVADSLYAGILRYERALKGTNTAAGSDTVPGVLTVPGVPKGSGSGGSRF